MTRFGDMKTIVKNIRFALLLGFMVIGMTAWSQIPNIEKLSVSTQMFLDELAGNVNWDKTRQPIKTTSNADIVDPNIEIYERPIARPDTIDGMVYVSSFIRVTNDDDINTLESMGVKIECRFDNGLLTALIPVDKILDVAAIDDVKRIEVATVMHTTTDNARQTTNTDDVLTLSQDAIAAGLDHQYDGSGIILGVIDTGIDYQHKAFQDKDGNSRIKGVYCYGSSSVLADWTGSGTLPTTDNSAKDHGSHTSSIAGGSNVIVNGTTVTVTDDPAIATYGGMAPGVDLFLAGIHTLYSTRISNAFQRMVTYANAQGKPLVVSNSYGSTTGSHEGNGGYAEVVNNYFGDNVSNRICLFSAGNSAGNADATEGGGGFISGTASSSNPLRTILRCHYYSNRDNGYYYSGDLASAWCRSTSVSSLGCRVMVLDTRTGAVLTTVTVTPTTGGATVNGLSTYYSGTLKAYKDYVSSDKTQVFLTASEDMKSKSYDTSNSSFYTSNYTLAVEFYPTSGSAVIDVWAQDYCYFTNYLTTSGYNWVNGSDDMTANDFANNANTIVVGSYVSRERSSGYSLGDISKFSSYATAEANPMGKMLPWITAPGEVIIGAYNHNNTSRGSSYVVSVNNSTSPYGQMSGTSMACPSAAGIVALWLQAANEIGKSLTLSEVKEIMKETAIRDYWVTDGPHASHFGNGKIDALAGIEYILSAHSKPIITATPTDVTLIGKPNGTYTESVTVAGIRLKGDITATLNDPNGVFSINPTQLGSGGELVITFTPTEEGEYTATVVLTSQGAQSVTITIHGTAYNNTLHSNVVDVVAYHSELEAGGSVYQFTEDDVIADWDMHLQYEGDDSDVKVLVKSDEPITGYELKRRDGEEGSWQLAGYAQHQGNSYVLNETSMTFGDGETEMWFPMNDYTTKTEAVTYYVPVTVANGVVTTGNTYGAPIVPKANDDVALNVIISGSKSDKRLGGHWTHLPDSVEYCVYTTIVDISSNDMDGVLRKPYLYRAWVVTTGDHPIYNFTRNDKNAIVGTDELETPYLLGEIGIEENDYGSGQHVVIGQEWDPNSGVVKMQNAFGAPSYGAQISVVVRAYYRSGNSQTMMRAARNGGEFGFAQSGGDEQFDLPTGVMEVIDFKEIVDVTYVNAMGMMSSKPFDGLNIVVTRYSDGTTQTMKVMK